MEAWIPEAAVLINSRFLPDNPLFPVRQVSLFVHQMLVRRYSRSGRKGFPLRAYLNTKINGLKFRAVSRLALALLAGGAGSAWAVSWTTGQNGGNWVWISPTNASVGVGTGGNTAPAEKLTVTGGNALLDNNRYYKGKTT
jgi:hypothetical protein